jgi:hypothetical protein
LVIRRPWRAIAPWASRRLGIEVRSMSRPLAVEPVPDSISGQSEVTTNIAERNIFGAKPQCLLAQLRWMYAPIVEQGVRQISSGAEGGIRTRTPFRADHFE